MSDFIFKQFAAAMDLVPEVNQSSVTDIVTAEDRKLGRATLDGASCNKVIMTETNQEL